MHILWLCNICPPAVAAALGQIIQEGHIGKKKCLYMVSVRI